MAPQFKIGSDQPLTVASPGELLASIESLVNGCLERGNVFAIIHYKGSFTQLFLDEDNDMHIETSLGDLAEYAGFNQSVPGFDWLAGNVLPADWHGRAKMAAEAMSRAFIDAANMAFPAALTYSIHPTQGEPPPPPHPQEPGHPTLGFCFGDDLPMNSFIDELGPPLGVTSRSIEAIFDAIQAGLETQHGKLTRTADWLHANMIVEIGGTGPVDAPNVIRFSAPHGTLVITDFEPNNEAAKVEPGLTAPGLIAPGLIEPARDLQVADAEGVERLPLVLMGIFNPAGPTLVALTAFRDTRAGETEIVVTMLNPFGQERKVVARAGTDSESIASVLPDIARHTDAPFIQGTPSLVIFGSAVRQDPVIAQHTMRFMWLLVRSRAADQLEEIVARYKTHLGRPWDRLGLPGHPVEPITVEPLTNPMRDWMDIMQDPEHAHPELAAIVNGWNGAIEHFGDNMAHMPLTEAGLEMDFLGFPFLPTE